MKLRSLAAALTLGATLAGPASAVVYTGIWDPPFGLPFTSDFSWRGTATFYVPDVCELAGTGPVDNSTPGGCDGLGGATVTSATVELYDNDGPMDLLATAVISPATMSIATLHYLAGDLNQLDTDASAPATLTLEPGAVLAEYGLDKSYLFSLQFTASGPRLFARSCANCDDVANDTSFPIEFSLTRVPEPATLALTGLAVFGLAAVRRRRKAG